MFFNIWLWFQLGFSAIFCRMRHSKPILLITIVQNVYKISHWSQSFETLLIISNKHSLHISWHLLELMLQIMIPYYTKLRRGPFKRRLIKIDLIKSFWGKNCSVKCTWVFEFLSTWVNAFWVTLIIWVFKPKTLN